MIDRDFTIRTLKAAIAQAGILGEMRRVARHFGMPEGRAWSDIPDADLDRLLRHTVGGEPLPAVDADPSLVPDESPEGQALNARLEEKGL